METTIIRLQRKKHKGLGRRFLIGFIIIAALLAGGIFTVFAIDHSNHEFYDRQLSEAENCLINKNYDEAISLCKQAVEMFPGKDQGYMIYADAYIGKGDKETAKNILEEAYLVTSSEDINKKLEDLKTEIQYDDYILSGSRALESNNYSDAIRYFKAAIDLKPAAVEAYLYAAEAYIANGDKHLALNVLNNGYSKTGSDRLRGKLIVIEGELQNEEHQQTAKYTAEQEAQEAKRKAEEEKRLKAAEEQQKKEEDEAKKAAAKTSKNTDWKDAYRYILRFYTKKANDPEYSDYPVYELDEAQGLVPAASAGEELSEENEDGSSENAEENTETDEETDNDESSGETENSETSEGKEKTDYAFELFDIDSDGIPELFISSDNTYSAEIHCYTYANETALPLNNIDSKGRISYHSLEKLLSFNYAADGIKGFEIYKKHDIYLDNYISFRDNFDADPSEELKRSCTINGVETEEGQYNVQLRKYKDLSWKEIGRKYKLNYENLDKVLDSWHL